jgi:hypothetical protein
MARPEDLPEAEYLGPLEYFEAKVLCPIDKGEQEICSFVLALSLAYNDVKDCRLGLSALYPYLPTEAKISASAGQGFGLQNHLIRHFYAVLYELLRLIKENPKAQAHPEFKNIVTALSKSDRKVWETLVELASGSPKTSGILRALVQVRDKTASHYYGLEGLTEGYKKFFSEVKPNSEFAYLSRGSTAATSRFYFADAAAQGHSDSAVKALSPGELDELSQNVSLALYQIVTRFIEKRAGGFYRVR